MRFYTNVQVVGDNVLVRGYENGNHFATREKFYPTLFVPSKKKTKHKTLEGDYVETVNPGGIRDSREFIKKYEGKCVPHKNEGITYEELRDKYIYAK